MKHRIEYYVSFENGKKVLIGQVQVKSFLCWHKVTEVKDEDAEYVKARSEEIVDILEHPNR